MIKIFFSIVLATIPFFSTIALENDGFVNQHAPIHQQFTYVDFGIGPFSFPSTKLGYRAQNNHHGIDIALQGSYWEDAFALYVEGSMAYQHYFCPNRSSQVYVGLGAAAGRLFSPLLYEYGCPSCFFISPEVSLGEQYANKVGKTQFVQIQVNAPIYFTTDFKNYKPVHTLGITLSYGIGF